MATLQEPSAWTNFLRGIDNKETAGQYKYALTRLRRFAKVDDPTKLFEVTDEAIENLLMDFIFAEKQGDVSAVLVRVQMSAVKKFYK